MLDLARSFSSSAAGGGGAGARDRDAELDVAGDLGPASSPAVTASTARDVGASTAAGQRAEGIAQPAPAEPRLPATESAQSSDVPQLPPDASHRRPSLRPDTVWRPVAVADDKHAAALARQAKTLESAGKWEEARAAYQMLEKVRPYRSETMYGQAWTAFQMNDARMAEQIAGQLATEGGPFKIKEFLYGDALFLQAQYSRAKVIYQKLRSELRGDQHTMAPEKIVACNKALQLPEADGITE